MLARSIFVALLLSACALAPILRGEEVQQIDLRRRVDDAARYYVLICARRSDPWGTGHSFVVWAHEDASTGNVETAGFGFYPGVERVVYHLFAGRGRVADESTKAASLKPSLLTHKLVVEVDRDTYRVSLHARDQWIAAGYDYHLIRRNCTHFVAHITEAIGLKVPLPGRAESPPKYLERMMACCQESGPRLRLANGSERVSDAGGQPAARR